ncbi:MAG TPA: hypothetical protein VIL32_13470, partial [Steroidobacteraceae bacterium]
GIAYELVPIRDLTALGSEPYGGNPALKMPSLQRGDSLLFGTQNICHALAEMCESPPQIVWPEDLRDDRSRNAQEMVWHAMSAQVQLVLGTIVGKLPADNVYFVKARTGFAGALAWLEQNAEDVLRALPRRDLSLFEVTLFCLITHMQFRQTLPLDPYPALLRFADAFAARSSAQRTAYRFD